MQYRISSTKRPPPGSMALVDRRIKSNCAACSGLMFAPRAAIWPSALSHRRFFAVVDFIELFPLLSAASEGLM